MAPPLHTLLIWRVAVAPCPEIGGCTSLLWLSLHANKLRIVPAELGLLTNMTRLSLHMLEVRATAVGTGQQTVGGQRCDMG
jgi:hypothetical protein